MILAKLMQLSAGAVAAISVKSTPTPVPVEIAKLLGAGPLLAAVFVCTTGIAGAVLGPLLLNAAVFTALAAPLMIH